MTLAPTHELHTHLYGAVCATRLWELARDLTRDSNKIAWYKSEFLKAYGRSSRIDDFWRHSDGLSLLTSEYCYKEPGAFAKFQASINLAIALFPLSTQANPLFNAAVSQHVAEGLRYAEYRMFLAPYFSEGERQHYMTALALQAEELERAYDGTFQPRIVFSLVRANGPCETLYASLRRWQTSNPKLRQYVVGIDFCASEDGFPPKEKRAFMQHLHHDNAQSPHASLAVLYHVGETFEHLLPESAIRWVSEAHDLGCHRLGHAVALGINASSLEGRMFSESAEERFDHLAWLSHHKAWLRRFGYEVDERALQAEQDRLNDSTHRQKRITQVYDRRACEQLAALQNAVIAKLVAEDAIIETCPTSNLLISHIKPQDLPALRFLRETNLKVVIGADDPGIFDCALADDLKLCAELGVSHERLRSALLLSSQAGAAQLLKKPTPSIASGPG